ncbi:TGB1 movement protein [Wineberry latent virus]|nr:TGB1 movement protein [Wineberry latent virus]
MFSLILKMKLNELDFLLTSQGFERTNQPLTFPLVIHGVPGCGKSTIIKALLLDIHTTARTCGTPYGSNLQHPGVQAFDNHPVAPSIDRRILDEYQLADNQKVAAFNILFGDPYQGSFRLAAHYIKTLSHRVPKPVCDFLQQRGFDITGGRPGALITTHPYSQQLKDTAWLKHTILHLGSASAALTHSHAICSRSSAEVQGLEFEHVTLIYHSSEKPQTAAFYVCCTRASKSLTLISDDFHEFHTAT